MPRADAELLNRARLYKAELMARMFGVSAQAAGDAEAGLSPALSVTQLPANSNIVGIGYGLKWVGGAGNRAELAHPSNEIALRVYVHTKQPQSQLSLAERVPTDVNGTLTDVIAVGDVMAHRPIYCGTSIGHHRISAGTLGCLLQRSDGLYILSNNHVLANCNDARIGDVILAPGPMDGGVMDNPIAHLADFEPLYPIDSGIENRMDAAIARVLNINDVLPEVMKLGKLATPVILAMTQQQVCKYGRTSSYTVGSIQDLSADINVTYPNGQRIAFADQLAIQGEQELFSREGDSGSLVVDVETRRPLALLFAGGRQTSFATPILPVLERFQATVAI